MEAVLALFIREIRLLVRKPAILALVLLIPVATAFVMKLCGGTKDSPEKTVLVMLLASAIVAGLWMLCSSPKALHSALTSIKKNNSLAAARSLALVTVLGTQACVYDVIVVMCKSDWRPNIAIQMAMIVSLSAAFFAVERMLSHASCTWWE